MLTIVSVSLLIAVATETETSVLVVGTLVVRSSTSWTVSVRNCVAVTRMTELTTSVLVTCWYSVTKWQQPAPLPLPPEAGTETKCV